MILNSKSEYNRCKIPRLELEELDEDQIRADEEEEMRRGIEQCNTNIKFWTEYEYICNGKYHRIPA